MPSPSASPTSATLLPKKSYGRSGKPSARSVVRVDRPAAGEICGDGRLLTRLRGCKDLRGQARLVFVLR